MPKSNLTWTEKLRETKEGYPEVEPIPERLGSRLGKGTLFIPAPLEVDEYMRQVPKGKMTTINEIRVALARRHGATISCPITTGIFSWIAAHAAEEQQQQGIVDITPYWRTLKTGGLLNEKYPGGVEGQRRLLENEGNVVVSKCKNYVVLNYQSALASL